MITLNINVLTTVIKRYRVAEWIRTHDPYIYCLQETHLRTQAESGGWEKNILCKWKQKKTGIAILISDKIDFKTRP